MHLSSVTEMNPLSDCINDAADFNCTVTLAEHYNCIYWSVLFIAVILQDVIMHRPRKQHLVMTWHGKRVVSYIFYGES